MRPQLAFSLLLLFTPMFAYAGIFSFINELLSTNEASSPVLNVNSQNMTLLQAAVNSDPVPLAKGGGGIAIISGSALLPESGPSGSLADVDSTTNQHGRISVYVVHTGDTLSQIAKMFGVTVNTIVWSNDIRGGLIKEGQTLVILPISGVQHTVKKGDTVASIAKFYRADADEIMQYNDLSEGHTLAVGSTVLVPDGEIVPLPLGVSATPNVRLRGVGGPDYGDYYLRPIIGGRKTQGLHGYNGVDLALYAGAPVLASATGEVIIARSGGWNGGYGNYIVISHDNGTQTLYSHLSQVLVTSGQYVVRGQVIGNVGSTGKSTGPHLHFEIRGARNPF